MQVRIHGLVVTLQNRAEGFVFSYSQHFLRRTHSSLLRLAEPAFAQRKFNQRGNATPFFRLSLRLGEIVQCLRANAKALEELVVSPFSSRLRQEPSSARPCSALLKETLRCVASATRSLGGGRAATLTLEIAAPWLLASKASAASRATSR